MSIKQRIRFATKEINSLPTKVIVPVCAVLFALVMYILAFVVEKPVQFSYEGETCVRQLSLFPGLSKTTTENGFRAEARGILRISGVDLLASQACIVTTQSPKAGISKVSVSPFGGVFNRKTYAVEVEKAPVARLESLSKPIPIGKPLPIALSKADVVNDYTVHVNGKTETCSPKAATIECPLNKMELEQGKEYDLKLYRVFNNKVTDTIAKNKITTLSATTITKAGLSQDQVIQDRPTTFEFEFDKEVADAEVKLVKIDGNARTQVDQKSTFSGQKGVITLAKELDRNAVYELSLDKLVTSDGSTLAKPYVANFKVSGGPKITGANIGSTGAGLSQTVVINFDMPLSDTQDISKFVSVQGVPASITKNENQIRVTYANAPKCTGISISIAKGIESKYQIAQTDAQVFNSRTVCHTVQTIGFSKEGRAIQAYFFGNGSQTVLFMGAIHGNEKSAKYIMDNWITDLEAKAPTIPADKQVVVIPVVNPDGFYKYGRTNANGVNLNRNWQTYNWTKDPETAPGKIEPGIGGPSAMSEVETQILARFTLSVSPRIVATYHSQGRLVNSNDVGLALPLGQRYAQMAGYQFVADAETTETFGAPVTGTYEDWLKERGIPGILMELNTNTGNHFSQNKASMWMLVNS
jgi:murein peptide amidase A